MCLISYYQLLHIFFAMTFLLIQQDLCSGFEVPYGVDVTYMNHTLDLVVRETGRIMLEKRCILLTYYYA